MPMRPGPLLASAIALLSACATKPPASEPEARAAFESADDPIEPANRALYGVSTRVDNAVVKPVARTYGDVVPASIRLHVTYFFRNLGAPRDFVNFVLVGRPRLAGTALMRFLIDSTLGVGGVFDVASAFGYRRHATDLGLTLGFWDVPMGPYLYIPLLGPSDVRDAASAVGDVAPGPLTFVPGGTALTVTKYSFSSVDAVDTRERALPTTDEIERTALDPYATARSLYQQNRQSAIEALRRANRGTVPVWFPAPRRAPTPGPD